MPVCAVSSCVGDPLKNLPHPAATAEGVVWSSDQQIFNDNKTWFVFVVSRLTPRLSASTLVYSNLNSKISHLIEVEGLFYPKVHQDKLLSLSVVQQQQQVAGSNRSLTTFQKFRGNKNSETKT